MQRVVETSPVESSVIGRDVWCSSKAYDGVAVRNGVAGTIVGESYVGDQVFYEVKVERKMRPNGYYPDFVYTFTEDEVSFLEPRPGFHDVKPPVTVGVPKTLGEITVRLG